MSVKHILALSNAIALQCTAMLSHAGNSANAIITMAPAPPPPPPAEPPPEAAAPVAGAMEPAAPIPVMDSVLFIVLGLVLVVIAMRFVQKSKGAQKLLSIAVLGTGLLVGGLGAERTIALIDYEDVFIAPDCDGTDINAPDLISNFYQITNDCSTPRKLLPSRLRISPVPASISKSLTRAHVW
ncbi:hypothetical protein GCM10007052_35830 [Halioglobus japonicus]|uniref:hypothetical protein n=2 Tax=Halioglobus japonicus TaxID=930805 RepID=UPI0015E129DB|nr:hypothetical protein [Halioglobus japonicus]GHD23284.1 hypothetical protein GCM10007052_35830 [Halioglobus japonicus]